MRIVVLVTMTLSHTAYVRWETRNEQSWNAGTTGWNTACNRTHSGKCGQYLISLGSSVRAIGQPVQPVQFTPHTQLHLLMTMLLSSACLDSLSQGRGHCLLTAGDNVLVTHTVSFICTSMRHTFALKHKPLASEINNWWNIRDWMMQRRYCQTLKHNSKQTSTQHNVNSSLQTNVHTVSCVDCNHVDPLQFLATRSTCTYREARRLWMAVINQINWLNG